jgi:hypothetical protein
MGLEGLLNMYMDNYNRKHILEQEYSRGALSPLNVTNEDVY